MVGFVARPHGVRGAVKVHATGRTVATLDVGERVVLDGMPVEVRHVGGTEQRPVLHFRGVDDRDAAAALSGQEIRVSADRLPEPDPGEFYVRDLVGCRVLEGDHEIGVIVEIQNGPANDALIVESDGRRRLIAFVMETIERIDLEAGELVVVAGRSVEMSDGA